MIYVLFTQTWHHGICISSIFVVFTVSEHIKGQWWKERREVKNTSRSSLHSESLFQVGSYSENSLWLQQTCHPCREADTIASEIQLPTCYQPVDSARTHILLRQDKKGQHTKGTTTDAEKGRHWVSRSKETIRTHKLQRNWNVWILTLYFEVKLIGELTLVNI